MSIRPIIESEDGVEFLNSGSSLQLHVSKSLPFLARHSLRASCEPATSMDPSKRILEVVSMERRPELPQDTKKIDLAFRVGPDFLYERCNYKFSRWEYLLSFPEERRWRVAVKGDYASSMAWPFRTVEPLRKFLHWLDGEYQLHAAAFAHEGKAILLMAPSGTGKTLTTLHWLCDGGQVFDDDSATLSGGLVLPSFKTFNFWDYRYRGNPDALPVSMPPLSGDDRKTMARNRFIRMATFGVVGLGTHLDVDKYWPDGKSSPAPMSKIVALRKGQEFSIDKAPDLTVLKNRLKGDFEFQSLPLLRWRDVFKLTGVAPFDCDAYFAGNSAAIDKLFDFAGVEELTVPSHYSRELFQRIKERMLA